MAIIIDRILYDTEKVLFFFHDSVENVSRTVSLSWNDMLLLNAVVDIKTKLENIRLKMIFIEGQTGVRLLQEKVIDGKNYTI